MGASKNLFVSRKALRNSKHRAGNSEPSRGSARPWLGVCAGVYARLCAHLGLCARRSPYIPTVAGKDLCVEIPHTLLPILGPYLVFATTLSRGLSSRLMPAKCARLEGRVGSLGVKLVSRSFLPKERPPWVCTPRTTGWRKCRLPTPNSPHTAGSVLNWTILAAKSRCQFPIG